MGWFSGLFGGKDKGSGENTGPGTGLVYPSVQVMPQYSFTEPRLQASSDFVQGNIERMGRGEYPSYFGNALPMLRENMSRPLYETYYGRPGERQGVLQGAYEAGAATGIGPRSTMGNVQKTLRDYATKEKEIDEYLTKLGVGIMHEDAARMPQLSSGMPKGPDAQLAYPTMFQAGGQAQPNLSGMGSSLAQLGGSLLDGMFNQNPTSGSGFGAIASQIVSGASGYGASGYGGTNAQTNYRPYNYNSYTPPPNNGGGGGIGYPNRYDSYNSAFDSFKMPDITSSAYYSNLSPRTFGMNPPQFMPNINMGGMVRG